MVEARYSFGDCLGLVLSPEAKGTESLVLRDGCHLLLEWRADTIESMRVTNA